MAAVILGGELGVYRTIPNQPHTRNGKAVIQPLSHPFADWTPTFPTKKYISFEIYCLMRMM